MASEPLSIQTGRADSVDPYNMLCLACRSLFQGALTLEAWKSPRGTQYCRKGRHHPDATSFKAAIAQKCRICLGITMASAAEWTEILSAVNPSEELLEYSLNLSFSESQPLGFVSFSTRTDIRSPHSIWFDYPLRFIAKDIRTTMEADLSDNTGSQQSLNQISQWISEENPNGQIERSPFYPTRLLKLGRDPNNTINLCISNDCEMEGPYMTLSHCWGQRQPLQLTALNFESFQNCISFDLLPRTFKHAITVARHLKVKYLWVDCLCIIQDSGLDWQNEVGLMEDVYSNSYLNIAASHASDSNGGLFVIRDPYLTQPIVVDQKWENVDQWRLVLQDLSFWTTRIDLAPLNKRAWALQERILSPRTVHFTHDQIFWESSQGRACEIYPNITKYTSGIYPRKELYSLFSGPFSDIELENMDDPGTRWRHIVGMYTRCLLTKSEDKLPAIAGIAKRFASVLQDEYLVGLWRRELTTTLLWQVLSIGTKKCKSATTYRAPSWSWAALDGVIYYDIHWRKSASQRLFVKILECNVTTLDNTAFSQVTDGFLRLEGRLYPMIADKGWRLSFAIDCAGKRISDAPGEGLHHDVDYEGPVSVFCLPIVQSTDDPHIQCLILRPTQLQGTYNRFGFYGCYNQELKAAILGQDYTYERNWFESGMPNVLTIV